jgi:hypothetical protein
MRLLIRVNLTGLHDQTRKEITHSDRGDLYMTSRNELVLQAQPMPRTSV